MTRRKRAKPTPIVVEDRRARPRVDTSELHQARLRIAMCELVGLGAEAQLAQLAESAEAFVRILSAPTTENKPTGPEVN